MSKYTDLKGTTKNTFEIGLGKAKLDASGVTAPRTITLPDKDIVIGEDNEANGKLIGGGTLTASVSIVAPSDQPIYTFTTPTIENYVGNILPNPIGQSFVAGLTNSLNKAIFKLSKQTASTATLVAEVYEADVNFLPTGPILATSDTIDATTLPTYPAVTALTTFIFPSPANLITGNKYAVTIKSLTTACLIRASYIDGTEPNGKFVAYGYLPLQWSEPIAGRDMYAEIITTIPGSNNVELAFDSSFFIQKRGLLKSVNTIPISESPIIFDADEKVAYVIPNKISPGGNLNILIDSPDNAPIGSLIIGIREGSEIIIGSSMRMADTDSKKLYA